MGFLEKKYLKLQDKLELLQKEKRQLELQLSKEKRKRDARRKIIVGATMINYYQNSNNYSELLSILDKVLLKNKDRELFDLPELVEKDSVN